MIKIDTNNIKQWDDIKKLHQQWYEKEVFDEIKEKYECLKKISMSPLIIKTYTNLLKEIINIGPSYVVRNNLFFNYVANKKKILTLMLKPIDKNDKKSFLEDRLEKNMNIIKKDEFSKLIKDIRTINLNRDDAIKKILQDVKKYDNINVTMLSSIIKNFPTLTSKNIVDIKEAKKSIFEIKDFLPNNIFNYGTFAKKENEKKVGWGRHKLISMMEIEVCPYCQRNHISNYVEDMNKNKLNRTTADLDHFYSQSEFPYLALSLYNFIPSCQVCNSRFKGATKTYGRVLYPYVEDFDSKKVKFETSENILNNILDDKKLFFIRFKTGYSEKVKNTIDMLGLEKVYKTSHNKYIKNMLKNIEKKPKLYLESLNKDFFSHENAENEILDAFKRLVKEPYKYKIEQGEPLAKLTKDILEEFEIDI